MFRERERDNNKKTGGMENWGKIELVRFNDLDPDSFHGQAEDEFWEIHDLLSEEMVALNNGTGFWYNRNVLLKHFGKGNMYGLCVIETDEMFRSRAPRDTVFLRTGFYMLPCVCCVIGDEADIIWTHPRARKRGFAKKLVELLGIKQAYPLPDSVGFWEKCGVALKSTH